jgi:hypothetical protein
MPEWSEGYLGVTAAIRLEIRPAGQGGADAQHDFTGPWGRHRSGDEFDVPGFSKNGLAH